MYIYICMYIYILCTYKYIYIYICMYICICAMLDNYCRLLVGTPSLVQERSWERG